MKAPLIKRLSSSVSKTSSGYAQGKLVAAAHFWRRHATPTPHFRTQAQGFFSWRISTQSAQSAWDAVKETPICLQKSDRLHVKRFKPHLQRNRLQTKIPP
jgi:hypothetical protein